MYVSHSGCQLFLIHHFTAVCHIKQHARTKSRENSAHYSPSGAQRQSLMYKWRNPSIWCSHGVLSDCGFDCWVCVCVTHCRSSRTPRLSGPSSRWGSSHEGWNAGSVSSLGGTACSGPRPLNSHSPQNSAEAQNGMLSKEPELYWGPWNGLWLWASSNVGHQGGRMCVFSWTFEI